MISYSYLPVPYQRIITSPKRFICYRGGRGAGKTYCTAEALVISMLNATERGLVGACLRETQKSLSDSSKSVMMESIDKLGANSLFETSRTSDEIRCKLNDGVFKFRGCGTMQDVNRIKSIHNVRWAWIDEAQTTKEEVWDILVPSIRHPKAQIIVTFNPRHKTDFIYQDFVENPSKNYEVYEVNYYDNPWFFSNQAMVTDMQDCFERYPEKFKHIWLGGTTSGVGQILKPQWWNQYESVQAAAALCTGGFITADTAYKIKQHHDYSVLQYWGYNAHHLYLLHQERGKWEFPDLVRKFKQFAVDCINLSQRVRPDKIYIEDKASGISLVQSLENEGFNYGVIVPWKPKDYNFPDDKVGRAKQAAVYLERGCCYIPANNVADWARGFVNECSDFDPEVDGFDDQVDACTMAVAVFREMRGGMILNM